MRARSGSQEPRVRQREQGIEREQEVGRWRAAGIERNSGIVRAMKTAANKCGTQWHKAN